MPVKLGNLNSVQKVRREVVVLITNDVCQSSFWASVYLLDQDQADTRNILLRKNVLVLAFLDNFSVLLFSYEGLCIIYSFTTCTLYTRVREKERKVSMCYLAVPSILTFTGCEVRD